MWNNKRLQFIMKYWNVIYWNDKFLNVVYSSFIFFLNLSSTTLWLFFFKSIKYHPMTFQWENPLSRSIYSEPTALTLNSPQQFYGILAPTDNLNHHSSLEGTWVFGWERQFTAPVQARSCCPVLCVLSPLGFIILTHTKALNVYLPN